MGLPISSLIAQDSYSVTGVDLNQDKVNSINRGEVLLTKKVCLS